MWDMLESHERVPPQAPKWISQKIQDWLIQDWPRLSLLGNFYWKYAVCASLKVSNRFFHSPYLHSSFFGKSRQQEQDTLPPANSGWEYQAPTLIQTWFNLFFCAVHLFSAAYLKDLSCHWRERERDRETESSGIQIRIKKNTNKKLWRNYHFGKKKNFDTCTFNNEDEHGTFHVFPFILSPYALTLDFWTHLGVCKQQDGVVRTIRNTRYLTAEKKNEGWLGRSHQPVFPGGNMEKAAGFWWEFTEWFQNIRQNDSLNTKTELKLSKYEIKG